MKKSAKKCSFRLNAKLAKNGDSRTNAKLANEELHLKKAETIDRVTLLILQFQLLLTGKPCQ